MAEALFYAKETLKQVRRQRKLTQEDMTEVLSTLMEKDFSLSVYSKIEQGKYGVKLDIAHMISKQLMWSFRKLWKAK